LATVISAIAAACGMDLDIDAQLRTWGHYVPEPDFDPEASERAILGFFGG
jgi:hypothetical protein